MPKRCGPGQFVEYGGRDHVRLAETRACVHAVPDRLLRIVAVEPLTGGRKAQAFSSTAVNAAAEDVLAWYASRWSLEVTFHEAKGHLGFEQPQNWSQKSVQRTAPVALLLDSLIVLWFVQAGHRSLRALYRLWYTSRRQASFADMLLTLKSQSLKQHLRQQVLSVPLSERGRKKLLKTLQMTAALTA